MIYSWNERSFQNKGTAEVPTFIDGWNQEYSADVEPMEGGHDSRWQSRTTYTDNGLLPGTRYTYRVLMRDAVGNVTEWSEPITATTGGDGGDL